MAVCFGETVSGLMWPKGLELENANIQEEETCTEGNFSFSPFKGQINNDPKNSPWATLRKKWVINRMKEEEGIKNKDKQYWPREETTFQNYIYLKRYLSILISSFYHELLRLLLSSGHHTHRCNLQHLLLLGHKWAALQWRQTVSFDICHLLWALWALFSTARELLWLIHISESLMLLLGLLHPSALPWKALAGLGMESQ